MSQKHVQMQIPGYRWPGDARLALSIVVNVEEGSFVHDAYGDTRIITNSYHSFAVDQLAPCLTVVARTDDGVVEAIENKRLHIYGTQWHPELGYRMNDPLDMKLFENFFETCRKVAQEREG